MILHFFNPWHDQALACNKTNFTPPSAADRLRYDIGFIPAVWAHDGDVVLVADVCSAKENYAEMFGLMNDVLKKDDKLSEKVLFVTADQLAGLPIEEIDMWGWDRASVSYLHRCGVRSDILLSQTSLDAIRELSHRRHTTGLLEYLRDEYTIGFSKECSDLLEIQEMMRVYTDVVIKAPWSCSGRGIRFIKGEMTEHQRGWIKNLLKAQGSVIVEPYYDKVADFGMEFSCDDGGLIRYEGLSVFETDNWAYTGNILATEKSKRKRLAQFVPMEAIDNITNGISDYLSDKYKGNYSGRFGVDMMIVRNEKGTLKIHPCVEINLRSTMGHVALRLTPQSESLGGTMKIEYNNNYKLKINLL